MTLKVVKKPNKLAIERKVAEYDRLREEKKIIEERISSLSSEIKSYAESFGSADSSGSYYCDSEKFIYGSTAKRTAKLNAEKAMTFLKMKGYKDAIKTVEVIDEDVVEQLYNEGKITNKEMDSILEIKETRSISVKKKEEAPEVQVQNVALVKKPMLRRGRV